MVQQSIKRQTFQFSNINPPFGQCLWHRYGFTEGQNRSVFWPYNIAHSPASLRVRTHPNASDRRPWRTDTVLDVQCAGCWTVRHGNSNKQPFYLLLFEALSLAAHFPSKCLTVIGGCLGAFKLYGYSFCCTDKINSLKPSSHYMYHQFNIQQFCVPCCRLLVPTLTPPLPI